MKFGLKVQILRGEQKIAQKEFARRLDVNVSYFSKVENELIDFGDYPSGKFIHKLAAELKADEDEYHILFANELSRGWMRFKLLHTLVCKSMERLLVEAKKRKH